jgi:hypothetical protein
MISSAHRPLPDNTQDSQQTNIHPPGGIRTHNLSRRAAADLRLKTARSCFGGLVVSMLASGTRVRGFKSGQSRWIFQASEKSSACLPSEGKWKNLYHVPALRHVKEPSTYVNYECASKIPCIVPSFADWGLSCLYGTRRLWWWMRELIGAKVTIGL